MAILDMSKPNVEMVNSVFFEQVSTLINKYFEDKPAFKGCVSIYRYDEYLLNTATTSTAPATIYIEINAPDNYKPLKNGQRFHFDSKKIKVPALYLRLKTIKENIKNILIESYNENYSIWTDRYSVMISTSEESEDGIKTYYTFRIIPCLTYTNDNGCRGVIYYNDYNSDINIDYPKQSIINFRIKERETEGTYSEITTTLKRLYLTISKENDLPFEIFEILVYNVPNDLLINSDTSSIRSIIKYLYNKNISEFITIDNQEKAFVSKTKMLSAIYVKHALKQLNKTLNA